MTDNTPPPSGGTAGDEAATTIAGAFDDMFSSISNAAADAFSGLEKNMLDLLPSETEIENPIESADAPPGPAPPSYFDSIIDAIVEAAEDVIVEAGKIGSGGDVKENGNSDDANRGSSTVGGGGNKRKADEDDRYDADENEFSEKQQQAARPTKRRPALPTLDSVDAVEMQTLPQEPHDEALLEPPEMASNAAKRPLDADDDNSDEYRQRAAESAKRFKPTPTSSLDNSSIVDTLLHGDTSTSSLIDSSVSAVFQSLGIDLTAKTITPPGGFPSFRQSTPFNLFGIEGLQVALCTLDKRDARFFELFYGGGGREATFYALELQKQVSLGQLSTWLEGTVMGAVVLKDASVVYQSLPIDLSLPPGLNLSATITVDNTSPELNSVLETLCGLKNPELALRFHTPELPDWSSPLTFGSFAIDASIPKLAISLIKDHLVLTSLAVRVHGHMASSSSKEHNVIFKRVYDWQLLGSMDVTLPGLPTRELDFTLSKYDSRWKLDLVLDVDWENAFGIEGLIFENVALSSSVDTANGWRSASFALAAELSLANTHAIVAGSFSLAGDFSISFTLLDLSWDTIIAIHSHFHPGEEKLVAPEIPLAVKFATISFSRRKGFLFDLQGLTLGDYLGVSATLAVGPEGGLLKMQVAGEALQFGKFKVHDAGLAIAIGRNTSSNSNSKAVVTSKASGRCWSLMLYGSLTWEKIDFAVAGRLYTTSEAPGVQYTLACTLSSQKAQGFAIGDHIPGWESSIFSDVRFRTVGIFIASRQETELEMLRRIPLGYKLEMGFQLVAEITASERLSRALETTDLSLILALSYNTDSGALKASMMTHNLPPLRIGDSFRTGDIAFNLVVKPGSLAIEVVGTAYFLPEKDAKELELILEGSVSTTAFGIGGTANGLWHNPFGLCRELVLGPQLGLKIELSYAGGVPQNFALVAGGKWREMELQLALQVGPEPLLSFEMSNVDIGKIISMASDGELNAPPDFIFLEHLQVYASPRGAYLLGKYYKPGFLFDCRATIMGKHGDLHFEAADGSIIAWALIDSFDIGPFTICGYDGDKLKFDLKLGKVGNSCLISARLKGPAGLDARLGGICQLDPFYIYFQFELKFADDIVIIAYIKPKGAGELPLALPVPGDGSSSEKQVGQLAPANATDKLPGASKAVGIKNALGAGYEIKAAYASHQCSSMLASCITQLTSELKLLIKEYVGWLYEVAAVPLMILDKLAELLKNVQLKALSLEADLDTSKDSLVFKASGAISISDTIHAFCVAYDFSDQFKFVKDLIAKVKSLLTDAIDTIRRAVTDLATKAWNTLKDAANAFKETVSSVIDKGLKILTTIGRYILRIWKHVLLGAIALTGVDKRKACETVNGLLPGDGLRVQPWGDAEQDQSIAVIVRQNDEEQVYDLEFNLIAVRSSDGNVVDQSQILQYQELERAQGNTIDASCFSARIPVPNEMDEFERACMDGLKRINEAVFNKMHEAIDGILANPELMHQLDELGHELNAFGERIAEEFDAFVDGVERWGQDALHEIEEFGNDLVDGGKELLSDVDHLASDLASDVESLADDAVDVIEEAGEVIGDVTEDVLDAVGDGAEAVFDSVGEAVDDVGEAIGDAGRAIGEFFSW